MMLGRPTALSQHALPVLLSSLTAFVLSFSATGGELVETLLLAGPMTVAFAIAGFVGGLIALCGSLAGVTGVYALMNLILQSAVIPPGTTYFAVALGMCSIAIAWRRTASNRETLRGLNSAPVVFLPLLVALISGYVVLQWTRSTDLEFLNALGGSEDNAAWISGTRTFLAGEMTTDFLAHPTAKSPVTGTTLGFVADAYWIASSDTPEHLLTIRALRSAYALIVSLTAIAAGLWVSVVAFQEKTERWLSAVVSLFSAGAVFGSSLFLFVGLGFFSFINGLMFALVVAVGFESAYFQSEPSPYTVGVLALVLSGYAGAWWGVVPLAATLTVVTARTAGVREWWRQQSLTSRLLHVVVWLFALSTLIWTWRLSIGETLDLDLIGAAGAVPIVDTAWLPLILLITGALVMRVTNSQIDWRKRAPQLLLALYVAMVWLLSVWHYGEPRYASHKILVLLSVLAMVGFSVILVEFSPRIGWPSVFTGLAFVLLWSSIVHESHNGIRGIQGDGSTTTFHAKILETLNDSPDANIVCLHQDPDLRITAYGCSRLSAAFSPGPSGALREWTGALLNSDISPNGIEIAKSDHVGSRVLASFRKELASSTVVVIILGGNEAQGVEKNLGPDFWWVSELNWAKIEAVFL